LVISDDVIAAIGVALQFRFLCWIKSFLMLIGRVF
jgi:hypothetical protein